VSTLRTMLKQQTQVLHAALEATPLMQAMTSGHPNGNEYQRYLQLQWQLHKSLEDAIRPWLAPVEWPLRLARSSWLEHDLEAIGARPGELESAVVDGLDSDAAALGALYVLEGSSLGLQILSKRVSADAPGLAGARRFIVGHGDEAGRSWQSFLARLESVPEAGWPEAVVAADSVFRAFVLAFEDCSHD